jgi:MtN3 and saliva related transmembrane protein
MDKEIMMRFFQILTAVVGIVMSLGYFPQAYRLYKTKSAENISLVTFVIFALGTLIRTLYGVFIKDPVLILSFIVGVIGSWSVLFLAIKYKMKWNVQMRKKK